VLLTLSTVGDHAEPATDLGFVLHKHPDRVRTVDLGFGTAHVFYPEATSARCTATLFVDVDPIRLSRRDRRTPSTLEPYVNDRPYAASSFLSVAIGKLYRTAMRGVCADRPELVDKPFKLKISMPTVPCPGPDDLLGELFGPLGYELESTRHPLDPAFPGWGESPYVDLVARATVTVKAALSHLVVLLPVLDGRKHYWIDESEVDKLLDRGEDWLAAHPARELIVNRYLARRRSFARQALDRLADEHAGLTEEDPFEEPATGPIEAQPSLKDQRLDAVLQAVSAVGARRVVDLGCGEGQLLQALLAETAVEQVIGADASMRTLGRAARRLRLDELSERQRARVELVQSALTYRDERLESVDVATVVEVIEHLDPDRISAFTDLLFGRSRPATVIVTTPNHEYNARYEGLRDGELRHGDHRFEWSRDQFRRWASAACDAHGYTVVHSSIGPVDPDLGPPTQMAVFTRGRADEEVGQPSGSAATCGGAS